MSFSIVALSAAIENNWNERKFVFLGSSANVLVKKSDRTYNYVAVRLFLPPLPFQEKSRIISIFIYNNIQKSKKKLIIARLLLLTD